MDNKRIQAIDKISVARICSGQVITDLATAVKELVENSLDAGAKHVEVKLKEMGLDLIEVADNGSGVSPDNHEGLALKYHTSKLATFSDLTRVTSFGFRGEALSSLCELAGSFSVTTRAAGQSVGVKLSYGRDGKLLKKETAPRQVGTTISISNMFEPLPVRRGEFKRNIKKQYNRLLRSMQAYALISIGVRITVSNTKAKGGRQGLIGTQYNGKLEDNITNVFGTKFLSTLVPMNTSLTSRTEEADSHTSGAGPAPGARTSTGVAAVCQGASEIREDERTMKGMVSKAGEGVGRADNDRQFFYINGRPVDLPKLTRVVGEVWRTYEMKHKPAFILDVRLPPGSFDVNVTPDKREIFITDEHDVIDRLKEALHKLWAPSRYTLPVNQGQLVQARLTDDGSFASSQSSVRSPEPTRRIGVVSPDGSQMSVGMEMLSVSQEGGESATLQRTVEREGRAQGGVSQASQPQGTEENVLGVSRCESIADPGDGQDAQDRPQHDPNDTQKELQGKEDSEEVRSYRSALATLREDERSGDASRGKRTIEMEHPAPPGKRYRNTSTDTARESAVIVGDETRDPELLRDADEITKKRGRLGGGDTRERVQGSNRSARSRGQKELGENPRTADTTSGARHDGEDNAREASSRRSAEQKTAPSQGGGSLPFSLNGILRDCRRASRLKRKRNEHNASASSFSGQLSGRGSADDQDGNAAANAFSRVLRKDHFTQMRVVGQFNLGFIICLLGSDLFILDQHACDEKYNFEVLQKTTVIHQQPLVRPLLLETTASEEMTIMENLSVFEKNGFRFTVESDQPPTKKLKITAMPFSRGTQFGVDDVHEMASIVADTRTGETIRLPKARAMFASRACRSSIMIGRALDKSQMSRVVRKMATIEQPWNCPHGRPTMRHLADVSKSLQIAAELDDLLKG